MLRHVTLCLLDLGKTMAKNRTKSHNARVPDTVEPNAYPSVGGQLLEAMRSAPNHAL